MRRYPFWTEEDERLCGDRTDPRIPLLIKFAGQRAPIHFGKALNSLVLHDLALAVIGGEIGSAEQGLAWLENRPALGPSPFP